MKKKKNKNKTTRQQDKKKRKNKRKRERKKTNRQKEKEKKEDKLDKKRVLYQGKYSNQRNNAVGVPRKRDNKYRSQEDTTACDTANCTANLHISN